MFVWFCFYYIMNIGTGLNTQRDRDQKAAESIHMNILVRTEGVQRETDRAHRYTRRWIRAGYVGVQSYTQQSKGYREQVSVDKHHQLKSSHVCYIFDNDNNIQSLITSPRAE